VDVLADDRWVIVLRGQSLLVYARTTNSGHTTYPVFQHTFQWAIDSATMVPQSSSSGAVNQRLGFINILIRFSSGFPWPVNVIHHCTISLPNGSNVPAFTLRQIISAPVRLFSVSDMTIGSFGTAVWLDTHTEEIYGSAEGGAGQRLVGTSLSPSRRSVHSASHSLTNTSQAPRTINASSTFGLNDERDCSWVKLAVDEREGRIGVATSKGCITVFEYA
jgi:hypothetical protein